LSIGLFSYQVESTGSLLQGTTPQETYKRQYTTKDIIKDTTNEREDLFKIIMDSFVSICTSLPKIQGLTPNRKKHISARLNEFGNIDKFIEVFKKAENSDFLKGNNDRKWRCDFDWLMKPDNFTKVLEGNYDKPIITKSNQRQENQPTHRRYRPVEEIIG